MYKHFTLIDDFTRSDHYYITPKDYCLYYGEYTATKGYSHSPTNQLIFNLKALVSSSANRLNYKRQSISQVARILKSTITNPQEIVFVPIPPSKAKTDPLHDGRMLSILQEYKKLEPSVEYLELVLQTNSTRASHESPARLSPAELEPNYQINQTQTQKLRPHIIIFDDMLTTGSHFKAMQSIISQNFPGHKIGGLFVARRALGAQDPEVAFGIIKD